MIDMHTHLDLYPDALKIIDKVNEDNIFTLVVTTSPKAYLATSKVFKNYKNIHVSLGLHPEIAEAKANEVDSLINYIKNTSFVGEVGIDGSARFSKSLSLQTTIFERVLQECEAHVWLKDQLRPPSCYLTFSYNFGHPKHDVCYVCPSCMLTRWPHPTFRK